MAYFVTALLIGSTIVGLTWAAIHYRRQGLLANRTQDPAMARNHTSMARLLDHLLSNDFVRGVIPAGEKKKAQRLLREFYGDNHRYTPAPDYMEDE